MDGGARPKGNTLDTSRFSERHGLSPQPELQMQGMNGALRNSLWNVVLARLFGKLACNFDGNITQEYHLFIALQKQFFRLPMDELDRHLASRREWYKDLFMTMEWWQVFDMFEFVWRRMIPFDAQEWERDANEALTRENSGYRLVGGSMVPCNDTLGTGQLKNTLLELRCFRDLDAVRESEEHLKEALSALARRPQPELQQSAEQAARALSSVLAQFFRSAHEGSEPADPWHMLTSKELALPGWMSHAVSLAFAGSQSGAEPEKQTPADETEAWALVTLAASCLRLLLARGMKAGWLPERAVKEPEPSLPDPWGERHLMKTT